MPLMPTITVQLVHIQGPLKGQVSEFSRFPVHIGRHSSCQVRFGKEITTISRQHARIECKGNRFRIIDVSTNGTYINGKRIADVYLRDGDVITFSENGPKASFLTKIGAGRTARPSPHSKSALSHPAARSVESSLSSPPDPMLTLGADQELQVLSANAPLSIQFNRNLQSYDVLPITIGKDPDCDFVLADDELSDCRVQIFFSDGQYYAKDLTGQAMATVNGRPVETQSVLAEGAELSLSDHGPRFRFFGDGRLVEVQDIKADFVDRTNIERKPVQNQKVTSIREKFSKKLFNHLFKKEKP